MTIAEFMGALGAVIAIFSAGVAAGRLVERLEENHKNNRH